MCVVIGVLFACGTYLILRRQFLRMALGFGLYSHAVNLVLITVGGFHQTKSAPFFESGKKMADYMDPLPPDVILTAIVISFGVTALFLVLAYRTYRAWKTDDPEKI